jgi:hypothetical protein
MRENQLEEWLHVFWNAPPRAMTKTMMTMMMTLITTPTVRLLLLLLQLLREADAKKFQNGFETSKK